MSLNLFKNVASRFQPLATRTKVFSPIIKTPLPPSRSFSATPACSLRNFKTISQTDLMFDIMQRFKRTGCGQWMRTQVGDRAKMVLAHKFQQKKLNMMVPLKGKRLQKFLVAEYAKRAIIAEKEKKIKEKRIAAKAGKVKHF